MNLKQKLARLGPLRTATAAASVAVVAPIETNPEPDATEIGPHAALRDTAASDVGNPIASLRSPSFQHAADPAPSPRLVGQGELFTSGAQTSERLRRALASLPKAFARTHPLPPSSATAPAATAATARSRSLPVDPVQTSAGLLHVRTLPRSAEERHGRVRLSDAASVASATVARLALDPGLDGVDFSGAVYLDLETTGLAGGTGTLPVVVGLGWFEDGAFQLEQLFLRRPGEERPILARVLERLSAASALVSYNGKSFDWPLLRSRFVMNRMKAPPPPPHLDLLHAARRVFRWRGAGTRLADVERDVIGHRRVGDVPGSEIPERYFRYLRDGDPGPLLPVLEHNVSDVRLMAALLAFLCQRYEATAQAGDLRDVLGLGHVAFRNEDLERALRFGAAASASTDAEISAEGLLLVARASLRNESPKPAAEALERALARSRFNDRPPLHLALAKLYEHRLHDFGSALRHAALTGSAEREADRARRLERLHRRATKKQLLIATK